MSWMQKLHDTYERCAGNEPDGMPKLMPICHTMQQAQIEVILSGDGSFRDARVIDKDDANTLIPCTEESGGRAGSKPVNHPLCDKLQYVAGDFVAFGGEVTSGYAQHPEEPHSDYLAMLRGWANSGYAHPKLTAILSYVEKGELIRDLIRSHVLPTDQAGQLAKVMEGPKESAPLIFRVLSNAQAPEDAFVRWRVEVEGTESSGTWQDASLIDAWISFYRGRQSKRGFCMATGRLESLAIQHPAKLRHGGDKAKLISSNDTSGFTFRGRFADADEAASVGFEVTQKAHNALRWLIANQAYRSGDQAIVSWATSGSALPNAMDSTYDLLGLDFEGGERADTAQAFALRLASTISGYRQKLDPAEGVVVMAIDSATPGRMAISYYREIKGSEFFDRLEDWHRAYAWRQNFGKTTKFVGAPAPRDIAEAAYGRRLDDKLKKATVERLLPCIIDGRPTPPDLVTSVARRAMNRAGLEHWEWEKVLGIACALQKGHFRQRNYSMALETDRTTRDYLFGRLLAIAENLESYALSMSSESRDTTAARLMQRFADHPSSTWRTIEMSLRPYMSRLRAGERSAGFLFAREKLMDAILSQFLPDDFRNDSPLMPEFLLGFHCQRQALFGGAENQEKIEQDTQLQEK